MSQFVTKDTDKVLSVSWGSCEAQSAASDMEAQETLAEQANAEGLTILAAAGDNGSTSCYDGTANPPDHDDTLSPNDPASLPYVVSVGGTKLNLTAHSESAWNESAHQEGAGGGGVSNWADDTAPGTSGWCMPGYQDQRAIPGIISSRSLPDATDCASGYYRETPDVSANADPYTGYAVFISAAAGVYSSNGWVGIGGTSAATPLWAAIAALTDVSPYCSGYGSGNAGVLPQALYAAVAGAHSYVYGGSREVLYDVKSGNDDYTPSGYGGGLYPATAGYDMATGLGTPVVGGLSGSAASTYYPGFTALICRQLATRKLAVTTVSPATGRDGASVRVTIGGSGFLPVAGADLVREYQGTKLLATVTGSCTISACTVTLPAESARAVSLAVSVEDSANSAPVPFTYTAATASR
jgi:subtilase family serine protease